MTTTLGIVGGLGTETSCSFCLNVNHKIRRTHQAQPHIVLDNVPMSMEGEKSLKHGIFSKETVKLLEDSVQRLNNANASLIVIPCNTVHIFLSQLRERSNVPILSIIEETVKECQKRSITKVGVLSSTTTFKSGLYTKVLKEEGIECVDLTHEQQEFVSECILRIVNGEHKEEDSHKIIGIIEELKVKGAELVILGCTDLFLIVSESESPLPIINSTEVLENAAVREICNLTNSLP